MTTLAKNRLAYSPGRYDSAMKDGGSQVTACKAIRNREFRQLIQKGLCDTRLRLVDQTQKVVPALAAAKEAAEKAKGARSLFEVLVKSATALCSCVLELNLSPRLIHNADIAQALGLLDGLHRLGSTLGRELAASIQSAGDEMERLEKLNAQANAHATAANAAWSETYQALIALIRQSRALQKVEPGAEGKPRRRKAKPSERTGAPKVEASGRVGHATGANLSAAARAAINQGSSSAPPRPATNGQPSLTANARDPSCHAATEAAR